MSLCPCGSGLEEERCCAPLLSGKPAPTAEALMRSRYSAYALGQIDYLEKTSSPKALKEFDRAEAEGLMKDTTWDGLNILQVTDGGAKDQTGIVEFIFFYTHQGTSYQQHERAFFKRIDGVWLYESSDFNPRQEPHRTEHIGRNDPCPCGSNKKYKKCCGA